MWPAARLLYIIWGSLGQRDKPREYGNDPQYSTYIPVETAEQIELLKNSSQIELLQYLPQLRRNFPKDATVPTVYWVGKQ